MNVDQFATLWAIFGYIGQKWGTTTTCTMPQTQFQQVLQWQMERDPAYLAYYIECLAEYNALVQQFGAPAAMAMLFAENQLPSPKLPNVANHVLLEFMRWNVAFGGFQTFGYQNYNGWMGGGSYLSKPPPYRALPSTSPVKGPATGVDHV